MEHTGICTFGKMKIFSCFSTHTFNQGVKKMELPAWLSGSWNYYYSTLGQGLFSWTLLNE